ncbi:MAG: class I SAM-dependent methyltransferase [Bryobacteraceae bacterium]
MNPAEFHFLAHAEREFWWFRGMRRIMFSMLDPLARIRRIERVLEAGCGTGHFANLLEQRYGWRVVPVDLAREALEYGRRMGVSRLVQADIARLPFSTDSFDAVFSLDVLVHFPRDQEGPAVTELVRVLKPGGLLVLRTAALKLLRSRHSQFTGERQRFTAGRLRRVVEGAGVRTLRLTYANSLLMPVALVKFRIWEPLLRKPPASGLAPLPRWLDSVLEQPLRVESWWLRKGINLPFGQSLILLGQKRS